MGNMSFSPAQEKPTKKSILSFFPKHIKPRDVQREALLSLEQNFDRGDIFVVNLPVASGKSGIALTLAHWQKKAAIITPTKLLVDQYHSEYSYLHLLRSKADYYCSTWNCPVDKRPKTKKLGSLCKSDLDCEGCTKYLSDLRKARVMPYILANYYIYLAHKLYRDCLIVDEAHNLVPTIKKMASKKLWQFKYKFPTSLDSRAKIKTWAEQNFDRYKHDLLFKELYEELTTPGIRFLVRLGWDTWAKTKEMEEHPVIFMEPLDIRGNAAVSFMFPKNKVKKIILLSGTINRKDIEQLGLSDKKIIYISADSPIMAENRPVLVPIESKNMSYAHQDANLPHFANYLIKLMAEKADEKGLVHITYALAERLKRLLSTAPQEIKERLLFHNRDNKKQIYSEFRKSDKPMVLLASGMYEGLSLDNDAARWQVISKVPWPSLADPAIKYLSESDPEFYAWEASKTLQQAFGRIVRSTTDWGHTFIFDLTFIRLYQNNLDMYPKWLQDSITIEQK